MAVVNPYIAGSPVRGRGHFIGRTDVLRDVARVLQNPNTNALVLFGQRRIGKTSILLHIERELTARKEYLPLYFDLQDKAALPLPEVLYRMAQKVSQMTKIPLPNRENFDQEGRFFRETFIPMVAKTGKARGMVLLLDEFDVLDMSTRESQVGPAFFLYLRDWMKHAHNIQFIFVMGRRPEELSVNALSTFKAIHSRKVSLMNHDDSAFIIRASERLGSLRWSDEAVERVWSWTQGQPYFTQLMCSEIWEATLQEDPMDATVMGVDDVDNVVRRVLERGGNALQWIWNSLSPAERIVMAAMAESRADYINQDELTEILNKSKVRLILRELEVAPETLIRWDLLRPVSGGFRFAVPLLRRWVTAEKPLRMVKAELDNLEPLAENLYRSGEGFFSMGNLDEAERQLRNALGVNPNHFRARLMLGQVLIGQGNPSAAVEELEPAYEFDPPAAKSGLINALLAVAEMQNENEQLSTFNRILAIDPVQPIAIRRKQMILRERADIAERNEDLDAALKMYQQIDDKDSINRVQRKLRKRDVENQLARAEKYADVENWSSVIAIYQKLLVKYPEEGDWQTRLNDARTQARLSEMYAQALNVLQQGDSKLAQRLFGTILGTQPDYKDAALYLVMASRGLQGEALLQEMQAVSRHTTASSSPSESAPSAHQAATPRQQAGEREPFELHAFAEPSQGTADTQRQYARPEYSESASQEESRSDQRSEPDEGQARSGRPFRRERQERPTRRQSPRHRPTARGRSGLTHEPEPGASSRSVEVPLHRSPGQAQQRQAPEAHSATLEPDEDDIPLITPEPSTPISAQPDPAQAHGTNASSDAPTLREKAPRSEVEELLHFVEAGASTRAAQSPRTSRAAGPVASETASAAPGVTNSQTANSPGAVGHEFWFDVITLDAQGKEIENHRNKAYEHTDDIGGAMLEMIYVPAGTFVMGSPADEARRNATEDPQHQVTVPPLYVGKYPVTQAQWTVLMPHNPSRFKSARRPVENVSWRDAVEFCERLAQRTGRPYRLPSEAEWEYACRAGTATPFHFGGTIMPVLANYDCRKTYASGDTGPFRKATVNVGEFLPNAFGLYGMHGNVWEWCADGWHRTYQGAPDDGSAWEPEGRNNFRVMRGGSWGNAPRDCRSASRDRNEQDSWFNNAIGFRVVVTAAEWNAAS